MLLRASAHVPHCPRCFREIKVNAPVELFFQDPASGRKRYAHLGCRPPVERPDGILEHEDENSETSNGTPSAPAAPSMQQSLDIGKVAVLVRDCIQETEQRLGKEIRQDMSANLREAFAVLQETCQEQVEQMRARAETLFRGLEEHAAVTKVIQVSYPNGATALQEGASYHPCFERVLRLAAARKNVFVPGPTGSGKTFLARQVAQHLQAQDGSIGLPFASISCTMGMPDSELLGRALPDTSTGRNVYHPSSFVRIYEQGGVFLLDEVDAGDANTLLRINSAVANGFLPVPARTELPEGVSFREFMANPGKFPGQGPIAYRHPDFVLLAAANTWGSGADRQYVGRNQLDEATLDRFRAYIIPVDYDASLERRLCPHPGLYDLLIGWRKKIRECSLERLLSTRFLQEAWDSIINLQCQSLGELMDSFFGGWPVEEQTQVLGKPLSEAREEAVKELG